MSRSLQTKIWLVRHGATEWSKSGQHTGRTDLPLLDEGRRDAERLPAMLAGQEFSLVLSSPLQRAMETCRIAGFGDRVQVDENLMEWAYGSYDGKTTAQIRESIPGWTIWEQGTPDGETIAAVAQRAQRVIDRCLATEGPCLLFAHGHLLRILGAVWMEMAPIHARHLALETSAVCQLGFEREERVLIKWNDRT
jgi:broad specificity phosphatase PhoE